MMVPSSARSWSKKPGRVPDDKDTSHISESPLEASAIYIEIRTESWHGLDATDERVDEAGSDRRSNLSDGQGEV